MTTRAIAWMVVAFWCVALLLLGGCATAEDRYCEPGMSLRADRGVYYCYGMGAGFNPRSSPPKAQPWWAPT